MGFFVGQINITTSSTRRHVFSHKNKTLSSSSMQQFCSFCTLQFLLPFCILGVALALTFRTSASFPFLQSLLYRLGLYVVLCAACLTHFTTLLVTFYSLLPLPSNRHHLSCGDCLEGKGENYQVCSVQYCVQQLCTVQCTHI